MKHIKILFIIALNYIATFSYTQQIITVSQAKKSTYKTIQSAIDAVNCNNNKPVKILIKNGIYKEKVIVDVRKNFIHLVGENKHKTIVTFNNHSGY